MSSSQERLVGESKPSAITDQLIIINTYRLPYMQVRKQQLELDMEQQTGSK